MNAKPILYLLACLQLFLSCCVWPAWAETLTLERIDLSFKDGSRIASTALKEKLQATASLTLKGSGLLSGAWEVASPPSTGGTAVFNKIKLLRTMSAGTALIELESPFLPTDQPGLYLLRLQLDGHLLRQPLKPLRYQVSGR